MWYMQEYNRKRTETPEESIKQWTTALKPNKTKYNKGKKVAMKNLHTVYQSLKQFMNPHYGILHM